MTNTTSAASLLSILDGLTPDARAVVEKHAHHAIVVEAIQAWCQPVARSASKWLHMTAKYNGKCACCGAKVVPGQAIVWSKEHKMAMGPVCHRAQTRTALRTGRISPRRPSIDSRGNSHCG